jgi:antitoxin CcdA
MRMTLRMSLYDRSAPKRAANVSVNADLLRQAKALGVNLSRTLEKGLEEALREQRRRQWLEANRQAIADYNAVVERHGSFADDYNADFRPDGAS